MMWECHVYDSSKVIYDMILGRYLLITPGLNLTLSEHYIEAGDGTLKWYTAPIIDLVTYDFKYLNIEIITPGKYFMNIYVWGVYES